METKTIKPNAKQMQQAREQLTELLTNNIPLHISSFLTASSTMQQTELQSLPKLTFNPVNNTINKAVNRSTNYKVSEAQLTILNYFATNPTPKTKAEVAEALGEAESPILARLQGMRKSNRKPEDQVKMLLYSTPEGKVTHKFITTSLLTKEVIAACLQVTNAT